MDEHSLFFSQHLFDDFEVVDFSDGPRGAREAFFGRLGGSGWGPGGILGGLGGVRDRHLRQSDVGSIF